MKQKEQKMDHVKKARGRRSKASTMEVPEEFEDALSETSDANEITLPKLIMIRMRDRREYVVLKEWPEGWLVADMNPDFGKMGEVHFWRKEFIEEIKRRNYIIPERRKK